MATPPTAASSDAIIAAGKWIAGAVVLGAALLATRIASRPDSTGRRTYGSYRAEVFASALAVLAMLAETMIPEAFDHAPPMIGLITVTGFLSAFLLVQHHV